jgi:cytosine deaminase
LGLEPIEFESGAPAELLAVRAASLREAVATLTEARLVIHAGRVVARTAVDQHTLIPTAIVAQEGAGHA